MDSITIYSASLPILNGTLFEVKFTSNEKKKSSDDKTYLIEVIDVSGSMSGTPIAALNDCLVANPPTNLISKNRLRIVFNHAARLQMDIRDIMRSGGTTNFTEAFKLLNTVIKKYNAVDGHILFLTDGQNDKQVDFDDVLENLKQVLEKYNSTLHLIGYGADHDISLMENIVKRLSNATFDFAKNSDDLRNIINGYADIVNFKPINCKIHSDNVKTQINIIPNEPVKFFVNDIINFSEKMNVVYVDPVTNEMVQMALDVVPFKEMSEIQLTLEYIDFKVQQLKSMSSTMETKTLIGEIQNTRSSLNKISLHVAKEKKNRQYLCSLIEEIRNDINAITGAELTKLGSTDILARAVDLASKHGMRQGLQNKLARRVLKNNDDAILLNIREASKSLPENPDDLICNVNGDEFSDIWSVANWKEILYDNLNVDSEGDALCLCLKVARSSGISVVDSSQLKILDVAFEQCASWQTFISLYKLGLATDETGENVVGGFDFNKAVESGLLKNMNMMKSYNAVFPLYITKENWEVAGKHVMKWALGHIACMDHRGYNYEQQTNIPFKLLEFMERKKHNERTELYNKMLEQVRLVCCQYMDNDLITKTKSWVDDLINNKLTRESCPSLCVLIGRVLCLKDSDNKENKELYEVLCKNVKKLLVEEVRRCSRGHKGSRGNDDIMETITNIFKLPGVDNQLVEKAKVDKSLVTVELIKNLELPQHIDFNSNEVLGNLGTYIKRFQMWKQQLENNFKLDQLNDHQLISIVTWGIFNSDSVVSLDLHNSTNPIDNPANCIIDILCECWKYNRMALYNKIRNTLMYNIICASVHDYCYSDTIVPPFATVDCETGYVSLKHLSHLYQGSTFGQFLTEVRSHSGNIVNGHAKLDFLEYKLGWNSGKVGGNCFRM